jgi:hypothetical protein
MHAAETLVPETTSFEVEIDIQKLKRYKLPGTDQISAELIQAGGNTLRSEIHKLLILFGIRKKCQSSERNLLLYLFVKLVIKLTVIVIEGYHCYQLHTKFIQYPCLKVNSVADESIGDHQCGFLITDQLLIRYSVFVRYWRKSASIMRQYINYLYVWRSPMTQ